MLDIVNVEQAIGFEPRMEGEREQPFFVFDVRLAGAEVEKYAGFFHRRIVWENQNFSILFDDNKPMRIIGRFFHP